MPLRVSSNIPAINAGRHLNNNSRDFSRRIERLSSGLRINRGADDAAGLSVSEGMRAELGGMRQGVRNAEQGINLIQLAEGSLNEVSAMLQRMRQLAVQSSDSTINDTNRGSLGAEFSQLTSEIDRIALSATFNKQVLLTGFGNQVNQTPTVSTTLSGFTGATEVAISGAIPGTYEFVDSSDQDNQITLSVTLPDGRQLSQTIDAGATLDREGTTNLVATGTTFIANFDRLGVQMTLVGPGVDNGDTLRSTSPNGGDGGTVVINDQVVNIAPNANLADIATDLNNVLSILDPTGSAEFNPALNEVQINTAGHTFLPNPNDLLGIVQGNSYEDGRLDNTRFIVEEGVGGVLQVGPNNSANHRIALNIGDMRASGPQLNLNGLSVANLRSARGAIERVDAAILVVARQRGDLGAIQNRLQFTQANIENSIENLAAAESSIRDADMAAEISAFTRSQILTQASTAMITQANSIPQTALQLLQ